MASLLEEISYYELLAHTNFSFLVGASHPHEMVSMAAASGYRSLGIADYDGVYGLARSYRALQQLTKDGLDNGLKMTFGAEFHLGRDHAQPTLLQDTIVLIAQNHRGYFNLCRLASYAHRGGKLEPNLPLAYLLSSPVDGLIAIQPMRGLVHHQDKGLLMQRAGLYRDHFQGRFYLAVGRYFNAAEDAAIRPTLQVAAFIGVSCILSQDAFFHQAQQKDLSDLLHAIRLNKTIHAATRHLFVNGEHSLHSLQELSMRFRSLPIYRSALETARNLVSSCTFDLAELRYYYPKEMLPSGVDGQTYLEQITWEHATKRYGEIPPKVSTLLQHELRLIRLLGFADYFLTVWDIVRWAREQAILCQGRGSAANSAVCYVLGVTSVDPLAFDLLFERFMSAERGDPPDIDIDFEHERREEVIQYIYARYGRENAAMVANVITFRSKGAVRAVGTALGVPVELLDSAAKLLLTREYRSQDSIKTITEVKADAETEDVPWELWTAMAERLKGFPRHLGIHSGGFMLADKPLDWLVAQEPATMPGRTVIQWCKEDIEALGFFKIDVLALGIMTAIRKCFDLIQTHHRRELSLASIPADDTPTYDMICRADTAGTFQIESRAQMSMLPRLRPRSFYDLVIEIAIIRPGPIQGKMIHPFLRRRNGEEPVSFPDERLRPILERTLGIPIYQEQVMRIAMAVGGFSPGEADQLRKNIGSFAIKGNVSKWIQKLNAGMRANGISEAFITTIMQQMEGFAHYGFPESHSASFALLAYASCYLKCHYPAAFFAAILNSQPMGFYSPHVLLQTARHAGVTVLPICVAASDWDTKLEIVPGQKKYALRMGLRLVRALGAEAARRLVARRQALGSWSSLLELLQHGKLSRLDLTALAAADALRVFGIERRAALWLAAAAPFCEFLEDVEEPLSLRAETKTERIQADFFATTTSLGPHPTEIIRNEAWCFAVDRNSLTAANKIETTRTNTVITVFGMVIVRQAPPSANGMLFLTIEDDSGLINLAVTPQVYSKYRKILDGQAFLCVSGLLQRQNTAHSILVKTLAAPIVCQADVIPLDSALPVAPRQGLSQELAPARNYI